MLIETWVHDHRNSCLSQWICRMIV
uniref:Uncharacterized protein n=1 Tax=Anguilla anguilla TaxID=7936 RepID=A0A0E9TI98_ANGAN